MKWYDPLKATGPFGWVSWLISAFNNNDNAFQKIGNGLESVFNKYTGSALTGAEQEANRFSAEEAQKQRDWETEMSNTAMQRQVADMQRAGLNPALMYGGTSSSGASTPSGASASSVSPSGGSLSDIIGSVMDMALLKAQIQNINADTRQKNAQAGNIETLTPIQANELETKIRELNQNITESEARTSVALVQSILAAKETEWYERIQQSNIDLNKSYEDLNKAHEGESKERVSEIEQRIKNLRQEIVESMARCAVHAANAGYLDQATINAMEEQSLIEVRRAGERTQYQINEKVLQNYDTDKWFIRAQQGFGAARDLGIGVSSLVSGGLFSAPLRKIGYKQ